MCAGLEDKCWFPICAGLAESGLLPPLKRPTYFEGESSLLQVLMINRVHVVDLSQGSGRDLACDNGYDGW